MGTAPGAQTVLAETVSAVSRRYGSKVKGGETAWRQLFYSLFRGKSQPLIKSTIYRFTPFYLFAVDPPDPLAPRAVAADAVFHAVPRLVPCVVLGGVLGPSQVEGSAQLAQFNSRLLDEDGVAGVHDSYSTTLIKWCSSSHCLCSDALLGIG